MTDFSPPTAFDLWRLSARSSQMLAEANFVIGMRMLGAMGVFRMRPEEGVTMIAEKFDAAIEAQTAAFKVALKGGNGVAMAEAALRPVRRRTRANVARLARAAAG